jgi:WD40 repeat protein
MSISRPTLLVALLLALTTLGPASAQPVLPAGARLQLGTSAFRHTNSSHARLRVSTDGTLFSCDGGSVIRWDLQTGKKLRTYNQGWLFALSPDGKTLALFRTIHEIHLVDVASGKTLAKVDCPDDWIRCAAFSADSATLYTGGDQAVIRSWRATDGGAMGKFSQAWGSVSWLSLSADGTRCLCLADVLPSNLQVFDVAKGKPLRKLGNIRVAAATPDGKTAVASQGGDVIVWDVAGGKERRRFRAGEWGASALALAPDGNTVAVASGNDFCIFDLSKDKEARVWPEMRGPVYALAFSGDGTILAAAGWGGVIRLWDWRTGKELFDEGHRAGVVSLAFSPDGKTLLSRGMDYTCRVWELTTGKETHRFPSHEGGDYRAHFAIFQALDNQSLLRGVANGLAILDWKTGKERPLENPPKDPAAVLSPDSKRLVTYQLQGSWEKGTAVLTYTLSDRARGEKIREVAPSFKDAPLSADAGAWPEAVAIAPDGKTMAASWFYRQHKPMYTTRVGQGVSLWDVATGKERRIATAVAAHLAFLDGGKTLVCADAHPDCDKNVMEFWDVATGKQLRAFQWPGDGIGVLAFSPDGTLFAVAGGYEDPTVYLWRTATGQLIHRFDGHRKKIECLAFSPDGRMLASGSSDTTILLWEILRL